MPRPRPQDKPLIRKYLKAGRPSQAEAGDFGELKPVEPAGRRNGAPLLGDDQVYVMKYESKYHTAWCQVVADKWDRSPRGLLVTQLADVGGRSRCRQCDRPLKSGRAAISEGERIPPRPASQPSPETVVPLRVVGVSHGILFLAAAQEYRGILRQTAVEPATAMLVEGKREGIVLRIDAGRDEPLVLVQLDPRVTFQDGPYQVRLRRPLLRSATKPYAVASVEPAVTA